MTFVLCCIFGVMLVMAFELHDIKMALRRHGHKAHDPDNGELYCTACATEPVPESAKFCPHCGVKFYGGKDAES